MTDSKRREQAAGADSHSKFEQRADTVVEVPKPTSDQRDYLESIKESEGRYDPTVVVGGPHRLTT